MPGWQSTVIGLQEARLVAMQTYLQSKVADLNTVLQIAPLSMPSGQATSANIIIGDPYLLDDSLKFLICVCPGGGRSSQGLDLESQFKHIDGPSLNPSSYRKDLHSRILVYIHPDTFPVASQSVANVNAQAEYRTRLLCRICDWIRADCFETVAGVDMMLTSQEYSASGDNLTMQRIAAINMGEFYKGANDSVKVQGAEILLSAVAQ